MLGIWVLLQIKVPVSVPDPLVESKLSTRYLWRQIICFVPLIDFFWLLFDRTADYMNFMHEAWPLPDFVENHFNQCPLCYASFKLFQETSGPCG